MSALFRRIRLLLQCAPIVIMAMGFSSSFAQQYPSRPINLLIPFAAGGPTDSIARVIAPKMSEALKQQIVVENVAGAGGMLAINRIVKSPPDGYTVLLADLALPSGLLLNKNFNLTIDDFQTVGLVNFNPMFLMARPKLAGSASELFSLLKADPSKFTLGHSGVGSNAHLCALLFQNSLGVRLTEVPFRGAGPAMTDLLAGNIDLMCVQSTTAMQYLTGDRLSTYGVTSRNRLDVASQVPSLAEVGLNNFDLTIWHGLYVPVKTPKDIVISLNRALEAALKDEAVIKQFRNAGSREFPSTERSPEAHQALLATEFKNLENVIQNMKIDLKQ